MTRVQAEVLSLLDEIDEICEKTGIAYYLVGFLLLLNSTNRRMRGYSADVAMTYDDFLRFREYVERELPEIREFESVDNSPEMPEVYYRYVNRDTLLLDLEAIGEFRHHGVAVNILIIRNESRSQKILQKIESVAARSKQRKKSKAVAVLGTAWSLTPPGIRLRILNRLFKRAGNADLEKKTRLKLPGRWCVSLPKNFWKESARTVFEGHEYRTVGDVELYLKKSFGENWWTRIPKHRRETYMTAVSTEIPYNKFLNTAPVREIDRKFLKKREKYLKSVSRNAPITKEIKESWNVMFGTEKKIELMERYLPQKSRILKSWEEGYHDDAMLMLEDYRREVEYFSARGYALWIDGDIWDIYLKWLAENGDEESVEKLKDQLRPQFSDGRAFS